MRVSDKSAKDYTGPGFDPVTRELAADLIDARAELSEAHGILSTISKDRAALVDRVAALEAALGTAINTIEGVENSHGLASDPPSPFVVELRAVLVGEAACTHPDGLANGYCHICTGQIEPYTLAPPTAAAFREAIAILDKADAEYAAAYVETWHDCTIDQGVCYAGLKCRNCPKADAIDRKHAVKL